MSMTYRQIQDAVISKCCSSSDRPSVQQAIQFRHAWLWDLADWSFRYAFDTVTFTSNVQTVGGVATDFYAVDALYNATGEVVAGIADHKQFFDSYNANSGLVVGTPSFYTVLDGTIYTNTLGNGSTGQLLYEKTKPDLTNDADASGLPEGYDLALVHGGKAEMFKLQIVPDLAASFDQDFTAAANALQQRYLREVKESGQQWGAYRPGC